MSEQLIEDYKKEKPLLLAFAFFILFIAVLFFMPGYVNGAEEAVKTTQFVGVLGGGMAIYIFSMLQTINSAIDLPFGLGVCSLVATGFELIPDKWIASSSWLVSLKQLDMGLFEYWPARIVIFIWFTIHLLLSFNCLSGTVKEVMKNIDVELGKYANTVIIAVNFVLNSDLVPAHAAQEPEEITTGRIVVTAFSFVMVMILSFVGHYFMSLMFWAIDIILIPFKYAIPFSTLILEIFKYSLIVALTAIAIVNPWIFVWIFVIIFIISVILFRKIYAVVNYFRYVYVRGSFRRLKTRFKKDYQVSLLDKKYAAKIKLAVLPEANLVIPVFVQIPYWGNKKKYELTKNLKRYQRWWLVSDGSQTLLCRKGLFGKYRTISITDNQDAKMYTVKSIFCYNLFWVDKSLYNEGDKLGRKTACYLRLTMSREYEPLYEQFMSYCSMSDQQQGNNNSIATSLAVNAGECE